MKAQYYYGYVNSLISISFVTFNSECAQVTGEFTGIIPRILLQNDSKLVVS